MASGPTSFVPDPNFSSEIDRARGLLFAHPRRWRVVYHYDGDGIASASAAFRALRRLGYPVQATALEGVEEGRLANLLAATRGPVLLVDTGASFLTTISAHPHPVIVLDHHQYPGVPTPPPLPAHVAFVNPLDWGVDGMTEMCAATLTWLFTIVVDPLNWDNAPFGLSGAIADRQHVGGFKGLNQKLVEEAVKRSLVVPKHGLPLLGATIGEALERMIDPFVAGLSGRPAESTAFLHGIGIDPARPPASLDSAEVQKLTAALSARLVTRGVRPEFVQMLRQPRWWLPTLGVDAEELSQWQNAAGRMGDAGVGVAVALGDPGAIRRAKAAETEWRDGVRRGLLRVEGGEIKGTRALQWFESPEVTLAGTQAGMAMNYLLDPKRPVVVFTTHGGSLKVSGRGTLWLVGQGLDLATGFREAAGAVGGEGGGHKVASGATLPEGRRDDFLTTLDGIVARQLHLNGGAS